MDWNLIKYYFINNIKEILDKSGESHTSFNIKLFGKNEKGKPKNNLFRSDQKEIAFSVVIRIAEILNRSVDQLINKSPSQDSQDGPGSINISSPTIWYVTRGGKQKNLLNLFKNKKRAAVMIKYLAYLEKHDPGEYKTILENLFAKILHLKLEASKKKPN